MKSQKFKNVTFNDFVSAFRCLIKKELPTTNKHNITAVFVVYMQSGAWLLEHKIFKKTAAEQLRLIKGSLQLIGD